jgi:hypothetical protein
LLSSVPERQKKTGSVFTLLYLRPMAMAYIGEERTVVHSGLVKIGQLRRGGDRMKLVLILVILILGSAAVQLDCTEQESKFYLEKKLQRQ